MINYVCICCFMLFYLLNWHKIHHNEEKCKKGQCCMKFWKKSLLSKNDQKIHQFNVSISNKASYIISGNMTALWKVLIGQNSFFFHHKLFSKIFLTFPEKNTCMAKELKLLQISIPWAKNSFPWRQLVPIIWENYFNCSISLFGRALIFLPFFANIPNIWFYIVKMANIGQNGQILLIFANIEV